MSQNMEALKKANEVRRERKSVRDGLRNRTLLLDQVILNLPECLRTAEVGVLLGWKPGWGLDRVELALEAMECSWSREVGDLTQRQISVLVGRIRGIRPPKPKRKSEPGACEECGESLIGYTKKKRFCPKCRDERDQARKNAWAHENQRSDCKGGCGEKVWKGGSGYCPRCTPRGRGGDWSRRL